jgi:hypothetical protein
MARPVEWDIDMLWSLYQTVEHLRRTQGMEIGQACRELAKGKRWNWRTLRNRYSEARKKCEQMLRDGEVLIYCPVTTDWPVTETPTFFRDGLHITLSPSPDATGHGGSDEKSSRRNASPTGKRSAAARKGRVGKVRNLR